MAAQPALDWGVAFLEQLYQELILEHYKRPRNRGRLEPADLRQEGLNPSCGDELELFVNLADGLVSEVKFEGEGCAISQATASLMTEAIKGKPVTEALELARKFKAMLRGEPPDEGLGELRALQGVSKLHARVKCATLPWMTLEQALGQTPDA